MKKWTEAEEGTLFLMLQDKCSIQEIAQELGRTCTAVVIRKGKLGLCDPTRSRRGQVCRRWTAKEDAAFLAARAEGLNLRAIAKRLGRTRGAVHQRAMTLHVTNKTSRDWVEYDDSILESMYDGTNVDEVAAMLGRTAWAVVTRARVLGLGDRNKAKVRALWQSQRDATLHRWEEVLTRFTGRHARAFARANHINSDSFLRFLKDKGWRCTQTHGGHARWIAPKKHPACV